MLTLPLLFFSFGQTLSKFSGEAPIFKKHPAFSKGSRGFLGCFMKSAQNRITGTATNLDVDASGASSFKGFDLSTDYCNVKASGASGIKITVNKELSATASGASDIDYKGTGVIRDIKTSGASSISRAGS